MSKDIILKARAINPGEEDYVVPITRNPSQADVQRLLEPLRQSDDVSAAMEYDGHKFDKPTLELRGEKGRFILMLQDFDADGEAEVRTFLNPSPKGDGSIWGDFFGASRIVEDFDLVLRAFCEFAETGNVSRDLMD